jgi:hypothetical protein
MADLLVHAATAFAPGRFLRDDRVRAVLYVGVCLPDVLYKTLHRLFGAPTWLCEPTHAPLGVAAWCWLLALLFEEAWRRRAFGALVAGSWLHLLVDLGKDYMGQGVILWAFPFSMDRVELGWYAPEDTVVLMVPAASLILATEAAARLTSRRRRTAPGSS